MAGISLYPSYCKPWIQKLLGFVGITRKTVACKNLIWIVLSFSRTSQLTPELEYKSVHELIFRTLCACKYTQTNQISSNKSRERAWKAPQTCNLCLDLIYRERKIWQALQKNVCLYLTETSSSWTALSHCNGFHHRSSRGQFTSASNIYVTQNKPNCLRSSSSNKGLPISVVGLLGCKHSSLWPWFLPRWMAEKNDKLLLWCDSNLALSI